VSRRPNMYAKFSFVYTYSVYKYNTLFKSVYEKFVISKVFLEKFGKIRIIFYTHTIPIDMYIFYIISLRCCIHRTNSGTSLTNSSNNILTMGTRWRCFFVWFLKHTNDKYQYFKFHDEFQIPQARMNI